MGFLLGAVPLSLRRQVKAETRVRLGVLFPSFSPPRKLPKAWLSRSFNSRNRTEVITSSDCCLCEAAFLDPCFE